MKVKYISAMMNVTQVIVQSDSRVNMGMGLWGCPKLTFLVGSWPELPTQIIGIQPAT